MLSAEGEVIYDGALSQVKSRGNSTFFYAKKSYQIKLDKKSDLLGNGEKVKTWVLLAQYGDATMFRDKLCKDIAADLGLEGTPQSDWVDLYYDGEYRGTYQLSEKVQVSKTGLDITDLEAQYEELNEDYGKSPSLMTGKNAYGNDVHYVDGLSDPEDLSEGFVIEENFASGDENSWFMTTDGRAFNIKYPENVSYEAASYISELFQELEDAVLTVDRYGNLTGINPTTGRSYDEIADADSLARMYLIYYWSNNQDAYCQSTFYYTKNGVLYAGPMWDSDQTFGISWNQHDMPADSPLHYDHLIGDLIKLPGFRKTVKAIYEAEFRPLAERYAREVIRAYEAEITASERMNHILWPKYYKDAGLNSSYPKTKTYSDLREDIEVWMQSRLTHMDEMMKDW